MRNANANEFNFIENITKKLGNFSIIQKNNKILEEKKFILYPNENLLRSKKVYF